MRLRRASLRRRFDLFARLHERKEDHVLCISRARTVGAALLWRHVVVVPARALATGLQRRGSAVTSGGSGRSWALSSSRGRRSCSSSLPLVASPAGTGCGWASCWRRTFSPTVAALVANGFPIIRGIDRRPENQRSGEWRVATADLTIFVAIGAADMAAVLDYDSVRRTDRMLPGVFESQVALCPCDTYWSVSQSAHPQTRACRHLGCLPPNRMLNPLASSVKEPANAEPLWHCACYVSQSDTRRGPLPDRPLTGSKPP